MVRLWNKLPVVVRASLVAAVILVVGVAPWSALAAANLETGRSVPWAAAVGLAWLGLLFSYLGGWSWPAATSDRRFELLRARPIRRRLWGWTLLASAGFAATLVALTVVGWMLFEVPSGELQEFRTLGEFPAHFVLPMLLVGSLVTGAVEEAAFRGYLQVPLERRYGATPAIAIVAVLFTLVHFPSPAVLPIFVVLASGWGVLAYLTNSILPGIVWHFVVDAAVWTWCWLRVDDAERIFTHTVGSDPAMRGPFVLTLSVAIVSSAVSIAGFWKLAEARGATPPTEWVRPRA